MKLVIVVLFLLVVAAILLTIYAFVRIMVAAWRYRQDAPARARRERLALLKENQELDDMLEQAEQRARERQDR